jgi:hypothetical protein
MMPIRFISVDTATDGMTRAFEYLAQHSGSGEWVFQTQFVDPAHQRQFLR